MLDTELKAFRQQLGLSPNQHTLGVASTNIPGLEDKIFKGISPKARKSAGLPKASSGPIQSPNPNPLFRNHAEEDIANQVVAAIENAKLEPSDLEGKTIFIHISNPTGACNVCKQGLGNPKVKPGVLKQLSQRYPGLTIEVTVEQGSVEKLVIQNGKRL